MLAHIRIQTVGEPSEKNSHPFVSGRFSFIHNGTLGSTDQLIFDPVRGQVFGETDSEYYFHLIIRDLDASEEHDKEKVSDAIIRTVHALRIDTAHEGGHFTSASSILTDGRYAYVLREFDEQHPFVQKNNSAGYYTLYLGQGPRDERIVCSEELHIPEVKWELLPNHSLTVVDLATGAFETKPV
jgi:glutamine amidotransferase